ncbi:MAG: hypothetical protein ABR540_11330 [Acidimicrobiales bacterium]
MATPRCHTAAPPDPVLAELSARVAAEAAGITAFLLERAYAWDGKGAGEAADGPHGTRGRRPHCRPC